ncbi:MAG: hypothetical protein CVV56_00240 [Tenericutes bacterium HGW-Tenericutes-1]|jgi:hypothetical protein|nr:MAG: hypothetical protein CVV56_00240 [Tenericutes bacterium HGW-Tenericutes-1]
MKKLMVLIMMCFILSLPMITTLEADEYQNYQEIIFDEEGHQLLKHYTKDDYNSYYSNFAKKYFMGWRILTVTRNETVEFLSETKLKIYNNGYSTIKHNITLTTKEETKFQASVTGELDLKVSGNVKKFKGGLDANIKGTIQYTKSTSASESYEFVIIVDPGTYVTIVTRGTGEISNGVAKHYLFWIQTKKGGWETFVVTTEYFEIIKERL